MPHPLTKYNQGNDLFNELMSYGMQVFLNQGKLEYWPKKFRPDVASPIYSIARLEQALFIQKNRSQLAIMLYQILQDVEKDDIRNFTLAKNKNPQVHTGAREKIISDITKKIGEISEAFPPKLAETISTQLFERYCATCEASTSRWSQPRFNTSYISDILSQSGFLYIYFKCLQKALAKAKGDSNIFQETLAGLLTKAIKLRYRDNTEEGYRFTLHKVNRNLRNTDKNWDDLLASIPPTATTLDFSDIIWDFKLTEKQLSRIPKNITQLIFPTVGCLRGENPRKAGAYLSFLPPHIKKIKINFSFNLTFPFSCQPSTGEKIHRIAQLTPCTLEQACISGRNFISNPQLKPIFPASYEEVFATGINSQDSQLPPISRGMKELLKHYLGTDERSKNEFFTTLWRGKHRVHRSGVEGIVDRIGVDLIEPEDILYALKLLRPENAKGGLQLRIHFFQDYLAKSLNQVENGLGDTPVMVSSSNS